MPQMNVDKGLLRAVALAADLEHVAGRYATDNVLAEAGRFDATDGRILLRAEGAAEKEGDAWPAKLLLPAQDVLKATTSKACGYGPTRRILIGDTPREIRNWAIYPIPEESQSATFPDFQPILKAAEEKAGASFGLAVRYLQTILDAAKASGAKVVKFTPSKAKTGDSVVLLDFRDECGSRTGLSGGVMPVHMEA